MVHEHSLIATVAVGLSLAFVLGLLAQRLKLPAIVGYLLAGILLGPSTPGFVGNVDATRELAQIGIALLMFSVGLHFSLRDLLSVRRICVPAALLQIVITTSIGLVLTSLWGWDFGACLVMGLSLSVASTVVLLRALEERGAASTLDGRIVVGWLLIEDAVMVIVLVVLPGFAPVVQGIQEVGLDHLLERVGMGLFKLGLFFAFAYIARLVVRFLLLQVAKTASGELFTLAVVATALGVALAASAFFDVSLALGAFVAGVIVAECNVGERAARDALPMQQAFSVLFFVSVGMLFDPQVLVDNAGRLLLVVFVVVLGKAAVSFSIVLLFRYPLPTALVVGAGLAQIGEFSFILALLGRELGVLPAEGVSLVLAASLISILANPLWFRAIGPIATWLQAHRHPVAT